MNREAKFSFSEDILGGQTALIEAGNQSSARSLNTRPCCIVFDRIHDYMFEESVCLLARATWFKPLPVENQKMAYEDDLGDFYMYEGDNDEDDDLEEVYFNNTASLRIGNRRWGDNGYVRSGRQEARPIHRHDLQESSSASSSREYPKKKELGSNSKDTHGRRARRALKREAADKAAASKHEQHLVRLGRK